MNDWYLVGLSGLIRVTPKQKNIGGRQQLSIINVSARKVLPQTYYWSAPSSYLGNKVSADGTCLNTNLAYWGGGGKALHGGGTEIKLDSSLTSKISVRKE